MSETKMSARHTPRDGGTITVFPATCGCKIEGKIIKLCPLHASAPELLEALKEFLNPPSNRMGGNDYSGAFTKARAAIAKAEGRS